MDKFYLFCASVVLCVGVTLPSTIARRSNWESPLARSNRTGTRQMQVPNLKILKI